MTKVPDLRFPSLVTVEPKVTVLRAMRFLEGQNGTEIARWCGGKLCQSVNRNTVEWINVSARTGTQRAFNGDWVLADDEWFRVLTNEEFNKDYRVRGWSDVV